MFTCPQLRRPLCLSSQPVSGLPATQVQSYQLHNRYSWRTPSTASLMLVLGDAWAAVTFTTYPLEGWHGTCGDAKRVA